MVFEAFSFLGTDPVHEESVRKMDQENRDHHIYRNTQRGYAAEQTHDQAQAAEELGKNCQDREDRRNPEVLSEDVHGSRPAVAAKPAQRLLGAVREEYNSQNDPEKRDRMIICGVNQFMEHICNPESGAKLVPRVRRTRTRSNSLHFYFVGLLGRDQLA